MGELLDICGQKETGTSHDLPGSPPCCHTLVEHQFRPLHLGSLNNWEGAAITSAKDKTVTSSWRRMLNQTVGPISSHFMTSIWGISKNPHHHL